MKLLAISLKDIKLALQDRGVIIQLFVLPLVFILIFTSLFAMMQGPADGDTRAELVVINLDQGEAAKAFLDGLTASGGVRVVEMTAEQAQIAYDKRTITRFLTIPAGFSDAVGAMQPAQVEFSALDVQNTNVQSLLMVIDGVARDISLQAYILESLRQFAKMQEALPDEFRGFTAEMLEKQARDQFASSAEQPLVVIKSKYPANIKQTEENMSMVQISVSGFTVLFVFFAAQVTARSIYEEKKVGSFRRLMAAPISKFELLAGKLLPNMIIVIIQVLVIFGVSMLLLPLLGLPRLSLGNDPLALALAVLVVAICSTSLGIVVAALAHTEAQIGGIASLILWVFGFLGGAIVPTFLFNNFIFSTLGNFVPQFWGVKAFQDILIRGYGLAEMYPSLLILLGFSLAFLAFGLWRFEYK